MSLYHKYRPQTLEDVQGNEATIATLKADLTKEDPPHALLFVGPTGCGKTTLARIAARLLHCLGNDFTEVDSADFRGIDTVREIRRNSQFAPMMTGSKCRVFLIDECHKMTNDAQNALLKGLEEAPSHVFYMLATTDPQKMLATIKGRCSTYTLSLLNDKQMFRLLRRVCAEEGKKLDQTVMDQIILDSQGHPRNALQILDQVLSVDPEEQMAVAKRSAETTNQVIDLCRAISQRKGWPVVRKILTDLKEEEPETVRRAILGYCASLQLKEGTDAIAVIMEAMMANVYDTGWPGLIHKCYDSVTTIAGKQEDIPF